MSNNKPALAQVKARKDETIESMIRRFTRQLKKSGGMEEIKENGPGRRFKSRRTRKLEKQKAAAKIRKQAARRARGKKRMKDRR
jgi:ribosomal protein S21